MGIKVGDVVTRGREVPADTLVKSSGGRFIWRRGDEGQIVKVPGHESWGVDGMSWWQWYATSDMVTIIALDVPADATADDLRTLAEVFEIREVVGEQFCDERWSQWCAACDLMGGAPWSLNDFTERLHKVGWRPGMTAEDAADLLAMPFTCCTCGEPITNSAEFAACRGAGPVRAGGVRTLAEVRDVEG